MSLLFPILAAGAIIGFITINKVKGLKNLTFSTDGIPEIWNMTLTETKVRIKVRCTNVSAVDIRLTKVFTALNYKGVDFAFNSNTIPELLVPGRLSSVLSLDYSLQNIPFISVVSKMIANKDYKVTLKTVYNVAGVPNTTNIEIDFSSLVEMFKSKI